MSPKQCVTIFLAVVCSLACQNQEPERPKGPTPARPSQPPPEVTPIIRACASAPPWASALAGARCSADGYVYGAGHSSQIPNGALLLHVAGDRARASLVEKGTTELRASEVMDLARCDDAVWALARRPKEEGEKVPACDESINARAARPDGCPEWSGALSTMDGERIAGVGYVFGDATTPLVQNAARNRAVNEQ
ncbi:MAG: hypothetical protein AAF658_15365, partial [Myxococcota bacterium]